MFKKEIVACCLMFLTACSWKPVYYQSNAEEFDKTSVVEIVPVPNEEGRQLTQKLKDILNPKDKDVEKTFSLEVSLKEQLDTDQGIVGDNTSTRATMRLTASFKLKEKATNKIVLDKSVFAVSSYNVLWLPYPTITAEQATRRRLIDSVAGQIGTHLAVYFNKEK